MPRRATASLRRRAMVGWLVGAGAWPGGAGAAAAGGAPVRVGLDAEFGLVNSTSAQAIELGLRVAIAEINEAGGVLGGRPIELVTRDNHSMPARTVAHLREFAAMPDLVAVFGGKFSPVMIDAVPVVHALRLPLLAVWSSADPIVDNGRQPNYVFRLALRDSLAMPKLLTAAEQRGHAKVGLLLANTGWGRSNLQAAERHVAAVGTPSIVQVAWHNWGENTLLQRYETLREAGAQAVLIVANDDDAAGLIHGVAAQRASQRLPLFAHQGLTGGRFFKLAGPALQHVDLVVLQTFSFRRANPAARARFLKTARAVAQITDADAIEAPTGVAHAYDMMHVLAKAVALAGSTDRAAVRDALERVPSHRGLIKHYRPPFTPQRHEALSSAELLLARYDAWGVLVPVADERRP